MNAIVGDWAWTSSANLPSYQLGWAEGAGAADKTLISMSVCMPSRSQRDRFLIYNHAQRYRDDPRQ